MQLWHFMYNGIVLPCLRVGLIVGNVTNEKVQRGLAGRRSLFNDLETQLSTHVHAAPRIWIHASSMGEFEQARPVIHAIKIEYPDSIVIVSLFSPSAFDHIGDFPEADILTYIPLDTPGNARKFLDLVRPDIALIVRHDFWPNHLYELNKRGIPNLLINCTIQLPPSLAFRLFPGVNKYLHGAFDGILTVSREAAQYAADQGWGRGIVKCIGDTRYDQVVRRAEDAESIVAPLRSLKGDRPALILGSSWPADEEMIFETLGRLKKRNIMPFIVAAPHEPTEEHMNKVEIYAANLGLKFLRLSELEDGTLPDVDVLIIDRIGILASLYALGDAAYVGGAFGVGIHNVLEPAALGKTVMFGPRYHNSYEAGQLKRRGVGFCCPDADALEARLFSLYSDAHEREMLGKRAEALVRENIGATERIVAHIRQWLDNND
ncbi:hypothetical protein KAR48_07180 [bacterium]|nr:hypothetical protein [bacterium]